MFFVQVPPPPALPALLPKPNMVLVDTGTFTLRSNSRISAPRALTALAGTLGGELRPSTGYELPLGRGGDNAINLHLDPNLQNLGKEGYRLQVQPNRVDLYASSQAGLFYSFQTLRELFPADILRPAVAGGVVWTAPCVRITDSPRFAWRGAHMDVSRHFEQKSFVEKFLDEMALHKLNVFHWHLVDDNGWRIEIKRYPKLTELGSGTDFSAMHPKQATRSNSDPQGGFFTQADIREVVAYAARRFITVLPEIEMPGHSKAAIDAYPELGNKVQIQASGGDVSFMGDDNVYNVDDSTIRFMKDVLDEVMALFPGSFIHVGGDEVWKEPWKHNPRAQDRIKALGLKSEDELQSWVIRQMDDYLTSKGRRLIGWDEILEGGLAPNAAVMSWRGIDGGIAAAQSGHDVVMAPSGSTYLDHGQAKDHSTEPVVIGGYLPLRDVYAYEPIPSVLSPSQAKHVLGLQGQLWSEFIPSPRHMEYQAYPRLCAIAEVGWSDPKGRNYPEFLTRVVPHLERLKVMDIAFRRLSLEDLRP